MKYVLITSIYSNSNLALVYFMMPLIYKAQFHRVNNKMYWNLFCKEKYILLNMIISNIIYINYNPKCDLNS